MPSDTEEPFDYKATQERLLFVAQFLADLDLQWFLEMIGRAESIGPMLDPTLYMRGGQQLGLIKDLANAARGMQKAFEKFRDKYPKLELDRIRGDIQYRGMSPAEALRGGSDNT